ncbi:MAG: alpha/beta fold hydrolase [Candidatus Moranbacteria bacterium]|nr:alpha/beta fold hydrolase [Candidatus Moranbacteria bacterium]
MKTSFQRIITRDSIELVGLLYEPEEATSKILVHVHGMAGNFYENKFLDATAETLTKNGIAFLTFNNRGCEFIKDLTKIVDGKRTIVRIGNAYEKFEDSQIDIAAAVDFVASRGFSDIHLQGHSLGAPKVAYYCANGNDERISSVIFLSPADMVGLAKMDGSHDEDNETAKRMISEGKGDELLPHPVWDECYLSANAYVSLGSKDSKVAIFNFHNPEDTLPLLSRITIPAYTVMGRKDEALVIPVEETMERTKRSLSNSPKAGTHILGDADHGYRGYEQELADVLSLWMK